MNIIKLKDIIAPQDLPWAEYYNKYLKGKYAYWVQMRYIVSFEYMRHEGYVACEEDITKLLQKEDGTYPKPYGAPVLDVYDPNVLQYVDSAETDRINSTVDFRLKNKYVTDEDITINELKKFRTWLASELLLMDQTAVGEPRCSYISKYETHILTYYKQGMYDSTIDILTEFGQKSVSYIDNLTKSSCGCQTNMSTLYGDSIEYCNPITIYKNNIYKGMIEMFSNINFWTKWSPEFIDVFKKYVDNIININFTFVASNLDNSFSDCGCKGTSIQEDATDILKRLSISLEYIKNGDISGHKNYITGALTDWATSLYEIMEW